MHLPVLALSLPVAALARRHHLRGDLNVETRPGMSPAASRLSVEVQAKTQIAGPAANVSRRNPGEAMPTSPVPIREPLAKIITRSGLAQEERRGG